MANQVKESQIEKLMDYVMTETTIECEECHKGDITDNDTEAEEEFYSRGWRIIKERCLCKKCVRKLKKKH